jgi:archaellum biogenesis ATPase FlaH
MNSSFLKNIKDSGARNPFSASQARDFTDEQLLNEFYPTSLFWSIFNPQHEIILGTRGSGKTILMRMACYNILRKYKLENAIKIYQSKKFIGFHIPINIDWTISITPSASIEEHKEYFIFSFNSVALSSFLDVLGLIIEDDCGDYNKQKELEMKITKEIQRVLFPKEAGGLLLFGDIKKRLTDMTANIIRWKDGELQEQIPYALYKSILEPLVLIIKDVTRVIGDKYLDTSWLACIDEADYVPEAYLKCINTFMRSAKKPFSIKMTIMKTKYVTRETLTPGVFIEPDGNDFNFRHINYDPNSEEYIKLINHIVNYRCNEIIKGKRYKLDDILGGEVSENARDKFAYILEQRGEVFSYEKLINDIVACLSNDRRRQFLKIKDDKKRIMNEYLNKFAPVYFPRRMKEIDSTRNNVTGWFSGPRVIRLITDGNPRKFIQIMKEIIDKSLEAELNIKTQQKVIFDFCNKEYQNSESFSDYGILLKEIIDKVGLFLSDRIHGRVLLDSGCSFKLDSSIFSMRNVIEAIKIGVDYNHLIIDNMDNERISENTIIRLSYKYAVIFYLPLRAVPSLSPVIRSLKLESDNEIEVLENYNKSFTSDQMEMEF